MHWATIEKRITIIEYWKHRGTEHSSCRTFREMVTNGANASYVKVGFAAYVLYMRVNYHVICKMESEVFCSSRE